MLKFVILQMATLNTLTNLNLRHGHAILFNFRFRMPRATKFSNTWQDSKRFPQFADWVSPAPNDQFSAKCKLCFVTFSVKNMGLSALRSHLKGSKHQAALRSARHHYEFPFSGKHAQPNSTRFFNKSVVDLDAEPYTPEESNEIVPSSNSRPGETSTSNSRIDETNTPISDKNATNPRPNDCTISSNPATDEKNTSNLRQVEMKSSNPRPSATTSTKSEFNQSCKHFFDKQTSISISDAEIRWCLKLIDSHFSMRSCVDLSDLMEMMFHDSDIAKGFSLGKDKASYMITFGLAPYFKDTLLQRLKEKKFSVNFDEAYNAVSKKNQCDVHVSYFDEDAKEVHHHYFGSSFLGHSTAKELKTGIIHVLGTLNIVNDLIQVGMDGPNVNFAVQRELEIMKGEDSPQLIDLGSCALHVIHGAYKDGQKATSWNLKRFLRAAHLYFSKSPAKRADYLLATDMNDSPSNFPMEFCSHRWLENGPTIERMIEILDKLRTYVEFENKKAISKRSKSENFKCLEGTLKDAPAMKLCSAQLYFSKFICEMLEPFLIKFQAERPLAVFLHEQLVQMIHNLLRLFVKESVLQKTNSAQYVFFEIEKEEHHKSTEKIDIGIGAKSKVKSLHPSEQIKFRNNCRRFLIALTKKIFERSPLKYKMTKEISSLSPNVIATSTSTAMNRMSSLLENLYDLKHLSATVADEAKRQFEDLLKEDKFIAACKSYKWNDRLDTFFHKHASSRQELWSVIQIVLILSHGNARIESGFSANKDILTPNLKSETLEAHRLVYDAIRKAGGPKHVQITPSMRSNVRLARQR